MPLRHTTSYQRRATVLVGIAIALIVGTGVATAAGTADVSDRTASIDASDQPAAVDDESAIAITLGDAPDGVQRYNLTVELTGPADARIVNVTAGDVEGFEVKSNSDDAVTFRAADLAENVQAGASDVTLGTLKVAGAGDSQPDLTVTTHDFTNDNSEQIDPQLSTESVSLDRVSEIEGTNGGDGGGSGGSAPTDALPGTPLIWAGAALGFTVVVGIIVAWRR